MQLNERCFRTLAMRSADVMSVVTADGAFRYVGEAMRSVLGYEPEALTGTPIIALFHPDDRPRAVDCLKEQAFGPPGGSRSVTVRVCRADGVYRRFEAVGHNLLHDPEIAGIVCRLRDVTERTEAERRLRETEALYQTLAQTAPVGIFQTDVSGSIVFANERLKALTGLRLEELKAGAWARVVHPEDRARFATIWAETVACGRPMLLDVRLLGAEGMARNVLCQSNPILDDAGVFRGGVGTVTDMSEYVRTAEALAVAEARNRAVVDAAADAILTIDERGIVQSFNRAAEEMFGIPAADILWRPLERLIPEPDRSAHAGFLQRYAPGRTTRVVGRARSIMALRGDGALFPIELSVSSIEIAGRRLFTGIVRDITERVRIEQELTEARDAAEAADRAKSCFMAAMSHELRTPLNAVIGFAQVIEMRLFGIDRPERYVEYATSIRKSGEHLLGIIEDILDLSKVEAGRMELMEQTIHLAELLEQSADLIAISAGQRGVALGFDFPPEALSDLPSVRVDPLRLRQVLLNLLSNAVKFTDPGGRVTLGVRLEDDGEVSLMVSDTGVGMAPDDLPKALAPFVQVDQSLTRRYEGLGLGLPLSKRLVEMHGGRLEIDSAQGRGTTVSVRLPAERVLRG